MLTKRLKAAFEENNGILTTKVAVNIGLSKESLRKAHKRGDIYKAGRGIYLLDESDSDEMYEVQARFTVGVYSHETAAMLHNMTRFSPFRDYMIVPQGYNSTQLKKNNIKVFHLNNEYLPKENVCLENFLGNKLIVTNKERTLIDLLRSKHTMGEVSEEAIESYINDDQKNINRLREYAVQFNIEKLIYEKVLGRIEQAKIENYNQQSVKRNRVKA